MDARKITLRICNLDIAVSIESERELEFRKQAKLINDDFARYKERFGNIEDEKIMVFLLLQTRLKSSERIPTKSKRPSFVKRFLGYFRADD